MPDRIYISHLTVRLLTATFHKTIEHTPVTMHVAAFTAPLAQPLLRHTHATTCTSPLRPLRPVRRARILPIPCCELTANDTKQRTAQRMTKTIDSVRSTFNTVRTGRASTSMLDRIVVSYYGAETPLNQLASISLSGTSTLVVEPYDKSVLSDVERALLESDIGITPNNDGSIIRLAVPPLTQERRKELVKQVKALAEDGRVAIRNIRRDAVDSLKKAEKAKELGKDESKSLQDEVQKLTDKHVKLIDTMGKEKETDIMKV